MLVSSPLFPYNNKNCVEYEIKGSQEELDIKQERKDNSAHFIWNYDRANPLNSELLYFPPHHITDLYFQPKSVWVYG